MLTFKIDTYENGQNESLTDRAYCQIKTFSDKGAERKAREEEKRLETTVIYWFIAMFMPFKL